MEKYKIVLRADQFVSLNVMIKFGMCLREEIERLSYHEIFTLWVASRKFDSKVIEMTCQMKLASTKRTMKIIPSHCHMLQSVISWADNWVEWDSYSDMSYYEFNDQVQKQEMNLREFIIGKMYSSNENQVRYDDLQRVTGYNKDLELTSVAALALRTVQK